MSGRRESHWVARGTPLERRPPPSAPPLRHCHLSEPTRSTAIDSKFDLLRRRMASPLGCHRHPHWVAERTPLEGRLPAFALEVHLSNRRLVREIS